jgi:hypothetical protein
VSLLASALLVSVLAGGAAGETEPSDLVVIAEFTDAGAIIPGNDVFIDGVKAGSVRRLALADGKARVTFSVDAAFTPLHTDATAAVRSISLLGERYLDLTRGTPSAPVLADGAVLPASQTQRTVELQEILDVIDQPTGTALAALIVAFGEGLAARGEDAAAAIDAMEPALTETARLLDVLGGVERHLAHLLGGGGDAQHRHLLAPLHRRLQRPLVDDVGAQLGRDQVARQPDVDVAVSHQGHVHALAAPHARVAHHLAGIVDLGFREVLEAPVQELARLVPALLRSGEPVHHHDQAAVALLG